MRCYICNARPFGGAPGWEITIDDAPIRKIVRGRDGKDICTRCLDEQQKDMRNMRAPDTVSHHPAQSAQTINEVIEELEERIPELFFGETCPLELVHTGCSCTYESGCKMLKKQEKPVKT